MMTFLISLLHHDDALGRAFLGADAAALAVVVVDDRKLVLDEMAGSGQNFQQMPHCRQLPRSTTGRMFRQAPVLLKDWEPTEATMAGHVLFRS
jgi:hypothetical protein